MRAGTYAEDAVTVANEPAGGAVAYIKEASDGRPSSGGEAAAYYAAVCYAAPSDDASLRSSIGAASEAEAHDAAGT